VADTISYGQQWYPVNQAYHGPAVIHSSDFHMPSGPMYVPYSAAGQSGPSSYGEGHYGPPPRDILLDNNLLVATGMAICRSVMQSICAVITLKLSVTIRNFLVILYS
jgi:hypothetical protein